MPVRTTTSVRFSRHRTIKIGSSSSSQPLIGSVATTDSNTVAVPSISEADSLTIQLPPAGAAASETAGPYACCSADADLASLTAESDCARSSESTTGRAVIAGLVSRGSSPLHAAAKSAIAAGITHRRRNWLVFRAPPPAIACDARRVAVLLLIELCEHAPHRALIARTNALAARDAHTIITRDVPLHHRFDARDHGTWTSAVTAR